MIVLRRILDDERDLTVRIKGVSTIGLKVTLDVETNAVRSFHKLCGIQEARAPPCIGQQVSSRGDYTRRRVGHRTILVGHPGRKCGKNVPISPEAQCHWDSSTGPATDNE